MGRPMVQYAEEISKESVVDVKGQLVLTPTPVSGCTQKDVELKIEEVCVKPGVQTEKRNTSVKNTEIDSLWCTKTKDLDGSLLDFSVHKT